MRRPPDTQPPTSHEVASSNSTLNQFLGGKQKSWMTGGASNVRPTPRDPARTSSTNSTVFQRNSTATVLPSPAPSDEPSPIQPQTESPAAEVPAEPMYQAPPKQQPPQQQQQLPPPPPQQQQQPQQQQPIYHYRQPLAPSPRTQNQESVNLNVVQNAAQTQHQNKRQRVMPPNHNPTMSSTPSLTTRVAMIDEYIRVSGFNNLNTTIERPRFSLLREACTMDDFFYVALHQIFCTWTVNQNAVLTVPDLPDPETLQIAFKILSQLIRDNTALTHCHLNWFTQFPAPLENLVASSDVYQKNIANVGVFLQRLRTDWSALTLKCQERGYPPLCDELVDTLNLLSPVLQNVFFTATRRNLNISDDQLGHDMEALFVRDRTDFGSLAARMNTDRPPTEKEMSQRRNRLIAEYLRLYHQHQRAHRVQEEHRQRPLQSVPVQHSPPSAPPNGSVILQQPTRSNSYPQAPTTHVQYARQESNPQTNGQSAYASPYVSPIIAQPPMDPRNRQNHSPHPAQIAPGGYTPSMSNGYAYIPGPVLTSNVASPVDRNYPSGHLPSPQYAAQQQQLQNAQQPTQQLPPQLSHQPVHQQQGQWMREFHQADAQDQRIRQVLMQQQNVQHHHHHQQQQQAHLRQQQMMQQRQAHPAVGSIPNPRHVNSRQNSGGHPYPQNPNTPPAFFSAPSRGVRKDDEIPFIPQIGAVPLGQPYNPDMTALHQAHVRSPRLLTAGIFGSKVPQSPEQRFYQAVKDFVIHPTILSSDVQLSSYEFGMTDAIWQKVARTLWPGFGELATRNVICGTLQYRFRCLQLGQDGRLPSENNWITTDTKWPEAIFVEVNGNPLELRRKLHHGKDLPVDITTLVKREGANTVRISLPRSRRQGEPNYAFAVEVVEVLQHGAILDMVLKTQRIPGSETLSNIMSKLSVSLDDDDDEIAMVASDLTIDLADPFTTKIFETPVRGVTCLHRECFDLETFLITRNSKPKRPEQPCMVDVWKCPLCAKDARPYSLRVDEFLLSVRTSLAEQGLLDCKAILVAADGNWKPKPEPRPNSRNKRNASAAGMDEDDDDDDDEIETGIRKTSAPPKAPAPEVIELDSD